MSAVKGYPARRESHRDLSFGGLAPSTDTGNDGVD